MLNRINELIKSATSYNKDYKDVFDLDIFKKYEKLIENLLDPDKYTVDLMYNDTFRGLAVSIYLIVKELPKSDTDRLHYANAQSFSVSVPLTDNYGDIKKEFNLEFSSSYDKYGNNKFEFMKEYSKTIKNTGDKNKDFETVLEYIYQSLKKEFK